MMLSISFTCSKVASTPSSATASRVSCSRRLHLAQPLPNILISMMVSYALRRVSIQCRVPMMRATKLPMTPTSNQTDISPGPQLPDDGSGNQNALQRQFRVSHQIGNQRPRMHAQGQEHLGNRHFDQGREIHEHPEYDTGQIGQYGVLTGHRANPLVLDKDPDDANQEDANHQQWKYHLHEAPGFPQPLLHIPVIKATGQRNEGQTEQRYRQGAASYGQRNTGITRLEA